VASGNTKITKEASVINFSTDDQDEIGIYDLPFTPARPALCRMRFILVYYSVNPFTPEPVCESEDTPFVFTAIMRVADENPRHSSKGCWHLAGATKLKEDYNTRSLIDLFRSRAILVDGCRCQSLLQPTGHTRTTYANIVLDSFKVRFSQVDK
jgi:hypothetical protein